MTSVCKRGHARTDENTVVTPDGKRRCRPCAQLRRRRRHENMKTPCPSCGQPMTHGHATCAACRPQDTEERFLRYVDKTASGWLWNGHRDRKGYGRFQVAKRVTERAHRAAWRLWVGDLAPGDVLHHECGTKACVNPSHLVPLTRSAHSRLHAHGGHR